MVLDPQILGQRILGNDAEPPDSGRQLARLVGHIAPTKELGKRSLSVDFGHAHLASVARGDKGERRRHRGLPHASLPGDDQDLGIEELIDVHRSVLSTLLHFRTLTACPRLGE